MIIILVTADRDLDAVWMDQECQVRRRARPAAESAINLQSLSVTHHCFPCTFGAVCAQYVFKSRFDSGFESYLTSHSFQLFAKAASSDWTRCFWSFCCQLPALGHNCPRPRVDRHHHTGGDWLHV